MYFVIEGVDGVGKSTSAVKLKEFLEGQHVETYLIDESSGPLAAEALEATVSNRDNPIVGATLWCLNRELLLRPYIDRLYDVGETGDDCPHFISARGIMSTIVYSGISAEHVLRIQYAISGTTFQPNDSLLITRKEGWVAPRLDALEKILDYDDLEKKYMTLMSDSSNIL